MKKMQADIDSLKADVVKIAARQEVLEKDVSRITADKVRSADQQPQPGAPTKEADIKVPTLKVVKVREDIPSKKVRDVVSTPERPFGDTGPEVSEGSAANIIQGATVHEDPGDPNKLYAKALQQYVDKDCGNAVVSFEEFVRLHPGHAKASQAVFSIAECYFTRGEFAIALSEFTRVADAYKGSRQVPMAMFKAGMCLKSLKDTRGARKWFEKVVEMFAGTEAAGNAEKELARLK